jgi:predicted helicase
MRLLACFGCAARDMSGERSGKMGENADIKLWRSDEDTADTEPFAAVEVKKAGGIDSRAKEQIKTIASLFGNAILTDNLEWRFYRAGGENMYTAIPLIERSGDNLALREEYIELFVDTVKDFLLSDPTQIRSSNKLAEYMAGHARTIRTQIAAILKEDGHGQPLENERQSKLPMYSELLGLYKKIKGDLRPFLDTRKFADMYAQTIVYGLFIARYNSKDASAFDRFNASGELQKESLLLHKFYNHIASGSRLNIALVNTINRLCDLYRICDIAALFNHDGRKDTIVHFYEDFLTYYDPVLRKELGVFYTPHQVVRYLVSRVDRLLVEEFGIADGLSNNEQIAFDVPCRPYQASDKSKKWLETKEISVPRVAVLDPACGTGTFHAEIISYIKDTYFSGVRAAFYKDYIQRTGGLLSRLVGFEIMMTSYAVAHLNVRRAIEKTLEQMPDQHLQTSIYLTNTLAKPFSEFEKDSQLNIFDFSEAITDEAYHADTWKTRRPIKVIIGNPPYLAASTNPYDVSAYKLETDGVTKLDAKNPKLLGDDYVKFFRFAEQIINKNNEGILAFVSNNGFLDNPSFRGMRASLLRTFDKIYIVDLHGSAKKGEAAPDGSKDENIFDIMQGVSLFIAIKTTTNNEWANVYHCDLWGTREEKYNSLNNGTLSFTEINLDPKMAYFIPYGDDNKAIYENGISIVELFSDYVNGIQSGNDKIAIAKTKEELSKRINIVKNAVSDSEINELWGNFGSSQNAQRIRDDVLLGDGALTPISFRPFDDRWTYYSGKSGGWLKRPVKKSVMGQFINATTSPIGKNIGLVFAKQTNQRFEWDGVFITENTVELHCIDYPAKSAAYVAPLYLKPEGFVTQWQPSFNTESVERLTENLTEKPTPIDVFDYVYGLLHDPIYRSHYGEYLSRDFPRIPIVESNKVFLKYVKAGERLRKLHLMQETVPAELAIEPNTADDLEIGKIKYKDGVLHLNANKRLLGIPKNVWDYRIGGYQVLDKWFKSHIGEKMTLDNFNHISNVVGLLTETIKIQESLQNAKI